MASVNIVLPQDIPAQLQHHVPYLQPTNPQRVRIDPALLTQLVETAFFASIATDEGRIVPLRLVFTERAEARRIGASRSDGEDLPWTWRPRRLVKPRPFAVDELARCARALQSPLSYVLVGEPDDGGDGLSILGFAHEGFDGPFLCVLAPRPGWLQFQFMPDAIIFEYRNGGVRLAPPAVFEAEGPIRQRLLSAAHAISARPEVGHLYCAIVGSLTHAMDNHRRGGILALLSGPARRAAQFRPLHDFTLARELMELVRLQAELKAQDQAEDGALQENLRHGLHAEVRWHEHCIRRLIAELGGFTATDGATLLAEDLGLIAFGEKLPLESGLRVVEAIHPNPGADALHAFDLRRRGARHRAAASFAWQTPGAVVFLASEDGGTRCFLRERDEKRVLVWRCRPTPRFGSAEPRRGSR
jgi:hypothetical protein